jgi:hypothetical protein
MSKFKRIWVPYLIGDDGIVYQRGHVAFDSEDSVKKEVEKLNKTVDLFDCYWNYEIITLKEQ